MSTTVHAMATMDAKNSLQSRSSVPSDSGLQTKVKKNIYMSTTENAKQIKVNGGTIRGVDHITVGLPGIP